MKLPQTPFADVGMNALAMRPSSSVASRTAKAPSFANELDTAASASAPEAEREARLRADARGHAETLVAQSLVAPLLAELRATNRAAEPFGVSDAEKRLGPVFDERIATQIVRRARFDIVDQVEASLLKSSGIAPTAPSPMRKEMVAS